MPVRIVDWTVDYGQGPFPCTVPHAWRQDVDVRWEGPAVYRTTAQVPEAGGWLVFWGVSYRARVRLRPLPPAPEEEGGRGMEVAPEPAAAEKRVGHGAEGPGSPSPTPPFPTSRDWEALSPGVENEGGAPEHHGIWDAFTVPLAGFEGQTVEVEVEVVKNGGPTFPVKDVASGFLPYVFNTFGGIWQAVELWETEPDLEAPAPPCRVTVEGTKIFVDGKPFYLRGVLTWGWYPELGNHPCPDEETIRREVRLMKELGFNTCKFCLWVPPHRYFEILEEEGMFAWMELPLWDPTPDPEKQETMFEELRRIVLQYRRHSNIVVWTCGCELSSNTTADYRRRLYEMVKELTGAALVKDNSGSSEMYGGDLREYGDFYDFHPYCDLPFYPVVLDSLLVGPREKKPILLGEFNDIDVHRDLPRVKREQPFWASEDPFLNDQGVRWEKPQLPRILETTWSSPAPDAGQELFLYHSLEKAAFLRKCVQEAVRSRTDLAGYVITGWRDTPISSSGVLDDWGAVKEDLDTKRWNRASLTFAIPRRRPPWVHGGNRPGWIDTNCFFEGPLDVELGIHADSAVEAELRWRIVSIDQSESILEGASPKVHVEALHPTAVGRIHCDHLAKGTYVLAGGFGVSAVAETITVFPRPVFESSGRWQLEDPLGLFFGVTLNGDTDLLTTEIGERLRERLGSGSSVVAVCGGIGTLPAPHWREAAYRFPLVDCQQEEAPVWDWPLIPSWEAFLSVSGDRVLDLESLQRRLPGLTEVKNFIVRVDTRTYAEAPILIRAKVGKGTLVATTLRPFGGLGCQPYGVMNNPAGADLLVKLMRMAEEG